MISQEESTHRKKHQSKLLNWITIYYQMWGYLVFFKFYYLSFHFINAIVKQWSISFYHKKVKLIMLPFLLQRGPFIHHRRVSSIRNLLVLWFFFLLHMLFSLINTFLFHAFSSFSIFDIYFYRERGIFFQTQDSGSRILFHMKFRLGVSIQLIMIFVTLYKENQCFSNHLSFLRTVNGILYWWRVPFINN